MQTARVPPPDHAPVRRRKLASSPEHLFAALDGRDLNVKGHPWHLQVYGICEQAGRRWIQVAVDGPQHYMLTIAIAADLGVRQAVHAVSGWLADPTDVYEILTVI